jgi:O-antigen/teichoic acid export membrane protein
VILRNILSNWAALIVTAGTSIVMTPLLIHGLGHFYFGLWILVGSFVDCYGLLDVGIRTTLQRFVAQLNGQNDRTALNETFATGLVVTGALSLLIVLLTAGLVAVPAHAWLAIDDDTHLLFSKLALYLGVSVAITVPARLLGAYLCGLQRFDLYNAVTIITTLLRAAGIIAALRLGFGVVGIAILTLLTSVVLFVLNWALLAWADPASRLRWKHVSLARARELFRFSVWVFFIAMGDYLRSYTHTLVIGRVLGIALITPFNVATKMMEYTRLVVIGATGPFMPAMSELDGQRRDDELRDLFITSTRMTALLVSLVAWLIVLNGDEFIPIWLGDGFQQSVRLGLILLVGFVVSLVQAPSSALLVARGCHRPLAFWTLGEGIANVLLSIHWAQRYGLVGVALGTAVPMIVAKLFVQPWYVLRVMELRPGHYLRDALARPLLVNLAFLGFCAGAGAFDPRSGVMDLITSIAWQTILFLFLAYAVGLTASSRGALRKRVRNAGVQFVPLVSRAR